MLLNSIVEWCSDNDEELNDVVKHLGILFDMNSRALNQLNDKKMESGKSICEILLKGFDMKYFLHRTISDAEKWIYFENPKWKKIIDFTC